MTEAVPSFFVYGEPDRPLDVGFLHVETVMARRNVHLGEVSAHRHARMAQITFWTSGHGAYFIEDRRLDFLAPTVSFVPSGVVHGFSVEPATSDAIVLSIADSALVPMRRQTILPLDAPLLITDRSDDEGWRRLSQVMDQIASEYRDNRPGADQILLALTAVALTEIARLRPDQTVDGPSESGLLASEFRRLVDLHFRDNWPVDRYVSTLGTTPHLLGRACEQSFGKSVKAFINERRLLEAKRLLQFTIRPLEDIAYEIGFKDAAYFSRFFKLKAGMSPSEWRADHSGAASR
ncbi:helix-turn-helix domain-containing protein [Rhizobium sp. FKL33]|uniref:helix-turn-helix domain-containing protein n=1 Tax=Rhizobium sp. FKL33 TaxID=2562307 RepID=UPI0010BFDAD8|nr:helix-turn-helix domain-containing protein [Rhizobium sp. FKL33]